MFGRSIVRTVGTAGFGLKPPLRTRVRTCSSTTASGAAPTVPAGGNAFLKAGITSGGLTLMGDILAQTWSSQTQKPHKCAPPQHPASATVAVAGCWGGANLCGTSTLWALLNSGYQRKGLPSKGIDLQRTARMASFGLLMYGPAQHVWYGWLARRFPGASVGSFVSKVALNQVALGPVVLSASFAWNLALTGQARKIGSKIRNDGPTTLANGWKFWIPASCINFKLVPLQYQVLYMSACGLLWTAYLSYASNL